MNKEMTQTIKASVTVEALTKETFVVIATGENHIYTDFEYQGEVLELFLINGLRDMLQFWLVDGNAQRGDVFKWRVDQTGHIVWADGDTDYPTITVTVNEIAYFDD